ncbi:OpgC domain-containing protein [Nocardioides deserti]|uniref:OpgC domain-containing protein n=1 Tax=Nocardioides deserti TaxID=1588644 RepID=A0ABR6U3J6_9ACTN|nr:OpgC domain-containing protein [Nocardioides deserti]MBC2958963.1 OpgC domain-containing protein [Nocardioides deserti]GGO69128.1 hypothetical protein GCM10012276_04570 [Nocardioides deserti]
MPARLGGLSARLAALLGTLAMALATAGPATATTTDDPAPLPPAGEPWFGPALDWTVDSADDYADRLGRSPSLLAQRVRYPLDDGSRSFLRTFVEQAAALGAVAVVDLEPAAPLAELTETDATALADELVALHDELDAFFLLRFAPEMNGSWYSWGQQPSAYVDAFRLVADVVHGRTPQAAMVWSPVYGAGYPYGAAYGDVDPDRTDDTDRLDTDGNGRLDARDDPYGPYWPGSAAVDWVGLTLYHFGVDSGRQDNELDPAQGGETGDSEGSPGFRLDVEPAADAFVAQLEERFNYGGTAGRTPFYERFAAGREKPMLVETGALWIPDDRGDPELDVKRSWWRQVLAAAADRPLLRGVSWLEQRRAEAEAGDRVVDWRATRSEELAAALRRDLDASGVTLAPVTDATAPGPEPSSQDPTAVPSDADTAPVLHPTPSATGLAVAGVLLALLLGLALVARARPAPARPGAADDRDPRLDLVRGVLLVGAVLLHLEIALDREGPVTAVVAATVGIEGFVLVAGLLLGLRHRALVARVGELSATGRSWRRAFSLWAVVVLATLATYAVAVVPGVDGSAVTRSTDGRFDLFPQARRLFDYPPPWEVVRELFVLRIGPWVLTGLGLFVVLLVLAPLVLAVVRRDGWWWVLPLSWAAYVAGLVLEPDWLPSQLEEVHPPLLHQVVLVHGIVIGHHHDRLVRWASRPLARALGASVVAAYAVALVLARVVGDGSGHLRYWEGALPPGRVVTLAVVALVTTAVLTRAWRPVGSTIGRVLVPLGRHPVPVVLLLVPLVLVVGAVR